VLDQRIFIGADASVFLHRLNFLHEFIILDTLVIFFCLITYYLLHLTWFEGTQGHFGALSGGRRLHYLLAYLFCWVLNVVGDF
jgi:hypothetical protein